MINNILTIVFAVTIVFFPIILRKQSIESLSSAATTLGILGTFVGILIGLMGFDPTDITGSVPVLLSGLKTAFITSVLGILVSLTLKFKPGFYGFKKEVEIESHEDYNTIVIQQLLQLNKGIENLTISIGGDGDSSMSTHLAKLRTVFQDKMDSLIDEFKDFANKQSENNLKALEDALNNMVNEFNDKLINEFGENFKALDLSVQKMLEWQKEYKLQIDDSQLLLREISASSKLAVENLIQVTESSSKFGQVSESLQKQIVLLDSGLNGLAELSIQAIDGFPQIKLMVENTVNDIEKFNRAISEKIMESNEKYMQRLENQVDSINEKIDNNLVKIDEALGEELNKSLNLLGNALSALSEKFVEDYTPLTEKLQKLVQISR